MGIGYTSIVANANGYISFNPAGTGSNFTNSIAAATSTMYPFLAPAWDDLDGRNTAGFYLTAVASYQTSGTVGSRVFTFEWKNWGNRTSFPSGISFQVKLFESTPAGFIQFCYRDESGPTGFPGNSGASAGIANSTTAYISLQTFAATPPVTYSTSPKDNLLTQPPTNTVYNFQPPSGAPLFPGSLTFSAVTLSSMTLSWVDQSGPSNPETHFHVFRSTDAINYTQVATIASTTSSTTGTTYTYPATGLAGNTLYYWRIIANNEGTPSLPTDGSQATLPCGISGTKNIGPTGDYATITAASVALQNAGAAGPVILQLQSTYNPATETYPILLRDVPCANSVNTITIRPTTSGVTFTGVSTTTSTFNVNAGKYWVIDGRVNGVGGKDMTIGNINTGTTTSNAIQFINDAIGNTVKFCKLFGAETSVSAGVVVFGTTTGTLGNNNNTIDNNDISNGPVSGGTVTPTNGIYASGQSTTIPNTGEIITNNNIFNFFNAANVSIGIFCSASCSAWTISNNNIYQQQPRTFTAAGGFIGISIASTSGNSFTVNNNFIGGSATGATGTAWTQLGNVSHTFIGIRLSVGTTTPSNVQGNSIQNILVNNTFTTASTVSAGISITSGSANIGTTSPNIIGSQTTTGNITFSGITSNAAAFAGILAGSGPAGAVVISNNQIGGITTSGNGNANGWITRGIWLQSATSYVVTGNIIGSPTTLNSINNAGNAATFGILSASGITANNVLISGNRIMNLVNTAGSAATLTANIITGISTTSGATTVTANTISNLTSAGTVTGIASSITADQQITRNKIADLTATGVASPVIGVLISAGSTLTVTNNIIGNLINTSANLANAIIGINITGGTTMNVYYNTVRLATSGGASFGSSAISVPGAASPVVTLRNNILINNSTPSGAGLTVAYRRVGTTLTGYSTNSNNNIFYAGTPAPNALIYTDGTTNKQDFLDYKTFMGTRDQSSATENTAFVSTTGSDPTFLHIDPITPTKAEAGAANVIGITDDFDGQIRQGNPGYAGVPALKPDIGADEGDFTQAVDQIAPGITYIPAAAACLPISDKHILANITDNSGVQFPTGGNIPKIYYRKNGIGGWTISDGAFISGDAYNGNWDFVISEAPLGGLTSGDYVDYFIVAQDLATIPNVGSNPGGAAGADVNSITTFPATPNRYVIGISSGTFTVGVGQNFETLTAAVVAYNLGCITGPITFNLTDATYPTETFPIVINSVAGASAANTLTISPSGGNSPVISGSNATALFDFSGARYVIIDGSNSGSTSKDLTISNTNTSGATIRFVNDANNNIIKNSLLKGVSTGSNGVIFFSTTTGANGNDNNTIMNNDISGGATASAYGIYNSGSSGTTAQKNSNDLITGNRIFDFSTAGIYDNGASAGIVYSNNEIYEATVQSSTTIYGARFSNTNIEGFIFRKNNIHDLNSSSTSASLYGIYLFDIQGTPFVGEISNNFINLSPSSVASVRGIYDLTSSSEFYNIYYNSINISGTETGAGSSEAYYRAIASVTNLTNNILVNTRTGGSLKHYAYRTTTPYPNSSDYNDIYNGGGTNNVFGNDGTDRTDLAAWKTSTGKDAHSISGDPGFTSATNLHIPVYSSTVDGKATNTTGITIDYDDQSRNASTPDIGADEYVAIFGYDVGIVSLLTPAAGGCYGANEQVSVQIKNFGSAPVNMSLNPITVFVTASPYGYNDGVQFTSGTLASGATLTVVMPTPIDMSVSGQYIFSASANVVGDINPTNNNLAPTSRFSQVLSGTYTVGAGGNYTNLTAAAAAFNAGGCFGGNVTFLLTSAYTSAAETFPITFNANVGQGTYSLTIKPAAGAFPVITGSNATALLNLNGAKYITVDGSNNGTTSKDLTISNTNTSGATIRFISDATSNTIKNSMLKGVSTSTSNAVVFFSTGTVNGNDTNTLSNNDISGGATPTAYAIYNLGSSASTAAKNSNNVITGNRIFDFSSGGIYDGGYSAATVISNNEVFELNTPAGFTIYGISPHSTTIDGMTIRNNNIHDISSTASASITGILLYDITSGTTCDVYNNFINLSDPNASSLRGIWDDGLSGEIYNLSFNTIKISGVANSGTSEAYYRDLSSVSVNKNNIFMNTRSAGTKHYAYRTTATYLTSLTQDYNDIYNVASASNVFGSDGTDRADLASWRTATTKDLSTVSVLPNFVSASDLHLQTSGNCLIDAAGTPIASITTDYDNDTRNPTTPDIGADEINHTYGGLAGGTNLKECSNQLMRAAGTVYFNVSCQAIAKVTPQGGAPITGFVNTCVTIDPVVLFFNAAPYVQRHFDVEPATNTAAATASLTLYFTQAEFTAYNLASGLFPKLPTGPNDAAGKANLNVVQYHGTATGPLPSNYPGPVVVIDPVDANIVWNATLSRWEVTFAVTGFSGFYVRTGALAALPITMEYFKGRKQSSNANLLTWKADCSGPSITFELQLSADGRSFSSLTSITASQARCSLPFDYTDLSPLSGNNYYRLKMTEPDGHVYYSIIVLLLNNKEGFEIVGLLPTLVDKGTAVLNISSTQKTKLDIIVSDMQGRVVQKQTNNVDEGSSTINMNFVNLAAGSYQLTGITPQGMVKTIRFVKQ